jgi:hypothetical protein
MPGKKASDNTGLYPVKDKNLALVLREGPEISSRAGL